jgi:hypothetical protein
MESRVLDFLPQDLTGRNQISEAIDISQYIQR